MIINGDYYEGRFKHWARKSQFNYAWCDKNKIHYEYFVTLSKHLVTCPKCLRIIQNRQKTPDCSPFYN